jgi:hypothetical protein
MKYMVNKEWHRGNFVVAQVARNHLLDDQAASEDSELRLGSMASTSRTLFYQLLIIFLMFNDEHYFFSFCTYINILVLPAGSSDEPHESHLDDDAALVAVTNSLALVPLDPTATSQPFPEAVLDTCM